MTTPRFESVSFSGGGCRCVWQAGFWQTVAPALSLEPRSVAAVSAGAATACLLFAGVLDRGLRYFISRAAQNRRNAYPRNLLFGRPVFPHEDIYRNMILNAIDDAAMRRLQSGPDISVLIAQVPEWMGSRTGVLAGILAYRAEQFIGPSVHPSLARKVGFEPEIVSLRECQTPEEIADLILQSSCTPPFTTAYRRGSRPVLDGCLVDGAALDALDGSLSPTLILLTRQYPPNAIPRVPERTYVQPSERIPVDAWDYTNPRGIQATYDLGRRDGERFVAEVRGRRELGSLRRAVAPDSGWVSLSKRGDQLRRLPTSRWASPPFVGDRPRHNQTPPTSCDPRPTDDTPTI